MELFAIALLGLGIWLCQAPEPEKITERIILLPSADGSRSAVIVHSVKGDRLMDRAYASLEVTPSGTFSDLALSESQVRERYASLLDAQAPRPRSFLLYFVTGSDSKLTTESQQTLTGLQDFLQSRPAPEVTLIGHTDRSGSAAINDALSLKRAQAVRELIRQSGVSTDNVPVYGRGSREPIASGSQEGLNRRVEIHVR
jgi:outer membrane protein OmpA-like peptidoglycan-associated protein